MTMPDDTRRLDACASWLHRPAGYAAMPEELRAAWSTAHDALVAADHAVRNLQTKLGRARERSRTTEQYMATLHSQLTAAYDDLWDAYLIVEDIESVWAASEAAA